MAKGAASFDCCLIIRDRTARKLHQAVAELVRDFQQGAIVWELPPREEDVGIGTARLVCYVYQRLGQVRAEIEAAHRANRGIVGQAELIPKDDCYVT